MRRGALVVVMIGMALLMGSYVLLTQRVVAELRDEASRSGLMYADVYRATTDTSADLQSALLRLAEHIRDSRVPLILTDRRGRATAIANLPFDSVDDPGIEVWIARLDRENDPIVLPDGNTIHIGHTRLVRGLRVIPMLQVATLALLVLGGIYALRTRAHADRERVWAGMARESAHQLGTPLSSLSGWLELLRENSADEMTRKATEHMQGDLERLERVAHRFERIGRPLHKESFDAREIVERVAGYFRARVPSLAHTVRIDTSVANVLPLRGDPVLVEWAIEAIVKNAIDALAGRGGTVSIHAERLPEGDIRVRISDDGPGVPWENRRRIFEAGFSTKERGWGIGLALARRIVAEWHSGSLALVSPEKGKGATFEIIFPA
jgi:signal transduction histidine kinase